MKSPKRSNKKRTKRNSRLKTDTATTASKALALHSKHAGKIELRSRIKLTPTSFPLVYTPGVGAVAEYLSEHPSKTEEYTARGRTVAVVSDGSAVLGLGNIGPNAALPVMEGKAVLFKELADLDAFPIVLNTQDPDEIVATVTMIAPSFGAVLLEDISSPRCFDIERRLVDSLSVPVIHDDQHGSSTAVLAGLINAHKVVGKSLERSRIAIVGAGAAGAAITKLLVAYGVGDVVVADGRGILSDIRTDLTPHKEELVAITNREGRYGGILEAMAGADAVVGVSREGTIARDYVRMMAQHPIVFALANPVPEISPDDARRAGAAVVATGRSDFPNQINNALVFPGLFKGALSHKVMRITDGMKIEAAKNIASLIKRPTRNAILPGILDTRVVDAVAKAVH